MKLYLIIYYILNGEVIYTNKVGRISVEKCYHYGAQAVLALEHKRSEGLITKYECRDDNNKTK